MSDLNIPLSDDFIIPINSDVGATLRTDSGKYVNTKPHCIGFHIVSMYWSLIAGLIAIFSSRKQMYIPVWEFARPAIQDFCSIRAGRAACMGHTVRIHIRCPPFGSLYAEFWLCSPYIICYTHFPYMPGISLRISFHKRCDRSFFPSSKSPLDQVLRRCSSSNGGTSW